jgi:phosphoglycolate phosphatase
VKKPDPSHLSRTLAAMDADAAAAVMAGDGHNDLLAATAAGIPSIWAAYGYGGTRAGNLPHHARIDRAEQLGDTARRILTAQGHFSGECLDSTPADQ